MVVEGGRYIVDQKVDKRHRGDPEVFLSEPVSLQPQRQNSPAAVVTQAP